MAFVRTKSWPGRTYYYLVETVRDDEGRPRQRELVYMGRHKTLRKAIEGLRADLRALDKSEKRSKSDKALARSRVHSLQAKRQFIERYTRVLESFKRRRAAMRKRMRTLRQLAKKYP